MLTNLNENQLYEEYNKLSSFELCVHAQEITQDAVTKIIDFINYLKATSTASLLSDQNSYLQRKLRFEETLSSFEIIFKRLRIAGVICNQRSKQGIAEPENSNNIELLNQERDELKLQVKEKNAYLKLAIDKVSEIIWQINSMQKLKQ
jgi:hypothetical protein